MKARAWLDNLKARLDKENIPYEVHLLVRRSSAGSDLVRFAVEHEIDE